MCMGCLGVLRFGLFVWLLLCLVVCFNCVWLDVALRWVVSLGWAKGLVLLCLVMVGCLAYCSTFVVMFCFDVVGYVWVWLWFANSFVGFYFGGLLAAFVLDCDSF